MSRPFKGRIGIDIRDSVPDWEPYAQPKAPAGAPNVLYIVLDDVGFSAMEPWGGLIETPNIKRLASNGLTYTNWHTTALCSPTRSSLLTGRNHTTNGMACIAEATTGFPGSNGHIPFECATIAEVLGERGWNTYMLGKWHLCPEDEYSMASTKRNWPVGRGMERFYGFLGGETNQWYPDLVYDNHYVDQPYGPEDGYHLTTDLVDHAIQFIGDAKVVAPDKPFFMYFCPGATHAPHHAPKEWIEKYKGKFDMGYERYRELVFENQKRLGVMPADAELTPLNPYAHETSADGKPWTAADTVRPWETLSEAEKTLFRRMAEVYAGFLSHTDHEIGRLLDYLEQAGELDNTIIVLCSDNGASGEGGPDGSVNENKFFNGIPDSLEENLKYLDDLGSPRTYNHYPTGWAAAFNTPMKMWKRFNFEGGTADSLIVSWPDGIEARGRAAPPVLPRHRHRADDLRLPRRRAAGHRQGLPTGPARGREPALDVRGRRCAHAQGDGVLLDARLARDLAPGLEGGGRPPGGAVGLEPLRRGPLGAVRHRGRSHRDARPGRPSTPRRSGSWWTSGTTRRAGITACRWTTGPRSRSCSRSGRSSPRRAPGTSIPRASPRCPRRQRSTSATGRSRSPPRSRSPTRTPAACSSRTVRASAATPSISRTARCGTSTTSAASPSRLVVGSGAVPDGQGRPLGGLREGRGRHADDRHADAVRRRGEGRRGDIRTQPGKFALAGEGLNIGRDGADPVTQDYPGRRPWALDRRHDQGGAGRRLRRAVRGHREGSGRGLHAGLMRTRRE